MSLAIEEATVLALGARGTLSGMPFRLAGRTCVRSASGGVWNEWTVALDDGRTLVLVEARGLFTIYEERPLAPLYADLVPGAPLDPKFASGFVVCERGEAERVGRWGEATNQPARYRYAELSSHRGEPVSIDWSFGAPRIFAGRRVALADLGLSPRPGRPRFVPAPGGPAPQGVELWLGLGDEGMLEGETFRVIGVLARTSRSTGDAWQEYLVHAPAHGFRWLVVSEGHWNLAREIEAGSVASTPDEARYEGTHYRPLASYEARIDWAAGDFPWDVSVGAVSEVTELVCAPHVLSREKTLDAATWSLATYLPTEALARAFGKRVLPRPQGRAPNQPRAPEAGLP